MKKLFLIAILLLSFVACERNVEDNQTAQIQQKNEQSRKQIDSTQSSSNDKNSSEMETTDPKDIIVPPRH